MGPILLRADEGVEPASGGQTATVKRLHCPTCANEVFFDSLDCVRCLTGLAMEVDAGPRDPGRRRRRRPARACKRDTWACNWLAVGPGAPLCRSCVLVDAGERQRDMSMVPFQSAQRRALYQLSELGVPWGAGSDAALRLPLEVGRRPMPSSATAAARSRSTSTRPTRPDASASGPRSASTTARRSATSATSSGTSCGSRWWRRTPTGWPSSGELFGDERVDYVAGARLRTTAASTTAPGGDDHASFYASAHPWEDFAESWAQLMHVHDVVETGSAWGVVQAPDDHTDAAAWLATSITASVAANELARAMGMRDLYPFALTSGVRVKVEFCWRPAPGPRRLSGRQVRVLARSTQNDRLDRPGGRRLVDGAQRHAAAGSAREPHEAEDELLAARPS